jgi:hypothetical protein
MNVFEEHPKAIREHLQAECEQGYISTSSQPKPSIATGHQMATAQVPGT